ncbi:preprotein translocase subunit SecG [Anaerofustis sp.]|uniref:preprotein translocase subunit SecG n=1 Tax=Anaerofustis sp. TaxID=1872517 RepID=UPI0025C668BC|nr:preprotein translocase subunit SecG [Anaerofustis sp.]
METVLLVLIVISSVALIGSVLFQEGSSAGMGGSIAGGAEGLFGKKKSHGMQGLLNKITLISAVVFFVSIFIFNLLTK